MVRKIDIRTVEMPNGERSIRLDTPYHSSLPTRLRALGGKWGGAWYLPTGVESEVRQLLDEVFGRGGWCQSG